MPPTEVDGTISKGGGKIAVILRTEGASRENYSRTQLSPRKLLQPNNQNQLPKRASGQDLSLARELVHSFGTPEPQSSRVDSVEADKLDKVRILRILLTRERRARRVALVRIHPRSPPD